MNILLLCGIGFIVFIIVYLYALFMSNAVDEKPEEEVKKEEDPVHLNPIERCKQLYEKGMYAELQRYAQRELTKDYNDIELRRILAQSLMVTGNEQTAIAHYEAILSIAPYDVATQELLAEYYFENGPKSRAIDLYEQIISIDQGNINAVEMLAKLYEQYKSYDRAAQMYEMLLDAEVESTKIVELQYTLADLYIKSDENQKALEIYEKIHESDPENLEILIVLAELAYKNQLWEQCLEYYQRIISIVGDDFEILEKIAKLLTTLEDWTQAAEIYRKIISLEDSSNVNYFYHQNELCNALLKNKQYDEAINILKELITKNPKETSLVFTLAQAYTLVGQYDLGVKLYYKLLDVLPTEQNEIIVKYISNLICVWAQDLFKKGEYNQAFDKFFEALKLNEENDEVYFQLGKCNYYIKSFQDSIAHFKRAIAIKPQESRYYFGLGCAYDEMGSYKNAKAAFFDAVNINPNDIQARIAYAIALTKELEYAKSIEQFLVVLKYIPNDADTVYNLALAYELVGDVERAIKYYKRAIEIDKKHKEARHNIELLLDEPYKDVDEELNADNEKQVDESDENDNSTDEQPVVENAAANDSDAV